MRSILKLAVAAVTVVSVASPAFAEANGTRLGVLECKIEGGTGLLVDSGKNSSEALLVGVTAPKPIPVRSARSGWM